MSGRLTNVAGIREAANGKLVCLGEAAKGQGYLRPHQHGLFYDLGLRFPFQGRFSNEVDAADLMSDDLAGADLFTNGRGTYAGMLRKLGDRAAAVYTRVRKGVVKTATAGRRTEFGLTLEIPDRFVALNANRSLAAAIEDAV